LFPREPGEKGKAARRGAGRGSEQNKRKWGKGRKK
jgi:hypothetical protein